jgi:hypothetical protein
VDRSGWIKESQAKPSSNLLLAHPPRFTTTTTTTIHATTTHNTTTRSYSLYLSYPTDHRSLTATVPGTDFVFNASLAEPAMESDPYSQNPRVTPTYNGYSPSGDVAGEVVYANYGREEDFAELVKRGIALNGTIALVRYGKSYRGAKVRAAHAAGCIACLIYSDPRDYDPHGKKYPDGDGLPLGGVQRGSVVAGGWVGGWMDEWMNMDGSMDGMDGWMDGWVGG